MFIIIVVGILVFSTIFTFKAESVSINVRIFSGTISMLAIAVLLYILNLWIKVKAIDYFDQPVYDNASFTITIEKDHVIEYELKIEGPYSVSFLPVFGPGEYTIEITETENLSNPTVRFYEGAYSYSYKTIHEGESETVKLDMDDVNSMFKNSVNINNTFLICYMNTVDELKEILKEVKSDSNIMTINNLFHYFGDYSITSNGEIENTNILTFLASRSRTDFNLAVTLVAILREAEIPARVLCTDEGYYIQAYIHGEWLTYDVLSGTSIPDIDMSEIKMML